MEVVQASYTRAKIPVFVKQHDLETLRRTQEIGQEDSVRDNLVPGESGVT